jgi:MYXO-CTERM domain-containing protein
VYSGDGAYASATATAAHVVGPGATSVTLTSSLNPSTVGANVTFTATLAAGPGVTGQIELLDGTTVLATMPLTGTMAAFTTNKLTQGTHAMRAAYRGDASHAGSLSATVSQVVNAAVTQPPADAGAEGGVGVDAGVDSGAGYGGDAGIWLAPPVLIPMPSADSCSCDVVGTSSPRHLGLGLALTGLAAFVVRRRRDTRRGAA